MHFPFQYYFSRLFTAHILYRIFPLIYFLNLKEIKCNLSHIINFHQLNKFQIYLVSKGKTNSKGKEIKTKKKNLRHVFMEIDNI